MEKKCKLKQGVQAEQDTKAKFIAVRRQTLIVIVVDKEDGGMPQADQTHDANLYYNILVLQTNNNTKH